MGREPEEVPYRMSSGRSKWIIRLQTALWLGQPKGCCKTSFCGNPFTRRNGNEGGEACAVFNFAIFGGVVHCTYCRTPRRGILADASAEHQPDCAVGRSNHLYSKNGWTFPFSENLPVPFYQNSAVANVPAISAYQTGLFDSYRAVSISTAPTAYCL